MTTALAALRESDDDRQTWEAYHRIGEVLRSDEMDVPLSAGFSARMGTLLDAEPTIVAPQAAPAVEPVGATARQAANGDYRAGARPRAMNRFFLPGAAAAAAVVAAVFVAMPQQAVVTADAAAAASPAPVTQVASVNVPSAITQVSDNVGGSRNATQVSSLAQQGEVKRDPRIDAYLFGQQRFSPSYNAGQYARSAAFSVDADK